MFWITLRAAIVEYFFALFLGKVTPVVHFDDGRLKAGLRAQTPSLNDRRHDLSYTSLQFAVVGYGGADGDFGGVYG